jgi:membrane protein
MADSGHGWRAQSQRMAHLSDIPKAVRAVGLWTLIKRVGSEIRADNLFTWAAALAYSWVFSIFPFLIFLLALLPHLPSQAKVHAQRVIHELIDQLPRESAHALWSNVEHGLESLLHQDRRVMLYVGLVVALWAASGGTSMVMSALDRCYELRECRSFLHHRLVALGMTVLVMAMLVLIVCLLPVASLVEDWLLSQRELSHFSPLLIAFDVARWAVSVLVLLSLLTLIYNNGPYIRQKFHLLTPGSLFCILVWLLLGAGFRLYMNTLGARSYDLTYGTVGGVVIMLFFFYVDALVLLIGAEINSEIDFIVLGVPRGTRDFTGKKPAAVPAAADCVSDMSPNAL